MLLLEDKIRDKSAAIAVVGLGYVGLPLAVSFSEAGFTVLGFDIKKERVQAVSDKQSYISDIKNEQLNFLATTDQSQLKDMDVICICVPTPLTKQKQPDLQYIIKETKTISHYMTKPQLVILESTTYPGTAREIVLPILENKGKRMLGKDFYLTHVPERIDPGNSSWSLKSIPKIVGGVDAKSSELARLLYSQVCEQIVVVKDADTAEMVKMFENTFRNVNIALVNEMLMLCAKMKLSIWEVIEAATTKPYGFMPFYPGLGPGGH
jgi:UDP-N-acetyl-D-glucosamine dehydrogenase